MLLITLLGAAGSYLWLGYADTLWVLFASRAVGGFMAGNISTAFAYIADVTTPENRAKGMGLIGAAFGLGFIAGPAIGGVLAGSDPANADFQTPALVAAGLSFAAFAMALVVLKESLSPEIREKNKDKPRSKRWAQFKEAIAKPNVGLLILLSFIATFVFAGMETTFAMWSRRQFGWGPEQNGWLFAGVGLLSALIQGGLVGRLARRFGEGRLIVQGAAALALGLALIPFSDTLAVLVVAMVILGYGFSIVSPSLNSAISLQVGPEEQGAVMGVTRSATTLARVVGPAWAGMLFATLGKDWPYWAGAALMVVVVVLGIRSAGRLRR